MKVEEAVLKPGDVTIAGLTKRELFAAMALQGLMTSAGRQNYLETSQLAVKQADALIKELNKEQE